VRMRQLLNASHGRRDEPVLQVVGSRSFA